MARDFAGELQDVEECMGLGWICRELARLCEEGAFPLSPKTKTSDLHRLRMAAEFRRLSEIDEGEKGDK